MKYLPEADKEIKFREGDVTLRRRKLENNHHNYCEQWANWDEREEAKSAAIRIWGIVGVYVFQE